MENRIKELRVRAGLSQQAVAERAGTTAATIMKLEKGSMKLTTLWMERIARVFECRPGDLLPTQASQNQAITNAEVALTDIFKVMIQIFLYHKLASPESFTHAFSAYKIDYLGKNLPAAAGIVDELLGFVTGEAHHSEKDMVRKLLQLHPQGSA